MTKHYIETNPSLELPDKINDGLELSKVVFVILSPDNRMDVSRYDYANKRWFSSKQPLWWLKEVKVNQVSDDAAIWLEETGISGDTMVDLDMLKEDPDKCGAMYLHDLLDAWRKLKR